MVLNSGEMLMGITWWLVAMTTLVVGLRFFARGKALHQIALDDWMMLAAWVLIFASQILLSVVYAYGLGQTDDLTLDQMMNIFKYQWIYVIPANLSSVFSRISIAILLARIFSVKMWFRWYLIVTTFISACLVFTLLVELWTSCSPISALWDPRVAKTATCLSPDIFSKIGYASQGVLTLTDITFVLFPVIFVWKLNMAVKKKIGLVAVFCLGLLTAVASLMKTLAVQSTSKQQTEISSTIPSLIWSTAEATLVIIMGCIPTLGPLTKMKLPNVRYYLSGSLPFTKSTGSTPESSMSAKNDFSNHSHLRSHPHQYYELNSSFKSSGSPMAPRGDSQASTPHLEKIHRRQSFSLTYEHATDSDGKD